MLSEQNRDRIGRLRQTALEAPVSYAEFYQLFFDRQAQSTLTDSFDRYADAYAYAMEHITVTVAPDELIVGRPTPLTGDAAAKWQKTEQTLWQTLPLSGQNSHMAVDLELVLREGLQGVLAKIDRCAAGNDTPFYRACRRCTEAVIAYSHRYADEAQRQASLTADPVRRAELTRLAAVCRTVPQYPATSFYEAVQAVHFIVHALSFDPIVLCDQQFQLGHPDRYLWPYYEADRAAGRLTKEEAQLLLDCLGVQINHRVPRGLSSGYMVGGRDQSGTLVCNELTVMLMDVIEDVQLVYPAVGLCYTDDTPEPVLLRACEILSHGRSHPAIFNDDVIAAGLRLYGLSEAESRHYIHSTCVEITPIASSNVWVASPYINLMQLLLDVMERDYPTLDALQNAYWEALEHAVGDGIHQQVLFRQRRAQEAMEPFLSCLVNDCLERGKDIQQGGGRYNWIMPSFVGMANLSDAFTALEQVVFVQKKYTVPQLKSLLDRNFEGCEDIRLELLDRLPKYGNDCDDADRWPAIITEHIISACRSSSTPSYPVIPSAFCWIMHEQFGRETGATPDGRKAGFPLGDGSGPAQGREKEGPTASLLSSTKWSHKELIGGVAVNMKFERSTLSAQAAEKLAALVKTYIRRGGFELQINVVDKATLLDAQKNPELYRDLVVRVGGYSDYFVSLSAMMQQEVIARTGHSL